MHGNIVTAFIGRLGQEPELKTSAAGKPWARLGVAVGAGAEAQWVSVAVFGEGSENLCEALHEGDKVYVEGTLRMSEWTGKGGEKRTGLSVVGARRRQWRAILCMPVVAGGVMQVGDPEEEIEKVAQAGIRGMVGALGRETISPHVMIEAALHVLAAWVASSQTHSPIGERAGEVEELLDVLPSYIEYHRTAGWLPEPHRNDN